MQVAAFSPVSSSSSRMAARCLLSVGWAPPPGSKNVFRWPATTRMPSGVCTIAVPRLRMTGITLVLRVGI